jgi:hypothetical protein
MGMQMWTFDESLSEARRKALMTPPTSDSIMKQIEGEMEVLCCHPQPCCDYKGFLRVVYCIRVGAPLFDLFFNSESGYRAAYYHSPYRGLETNAAFIQSVMPKLIAWSESIPPEIDLGFARESLGTPSAKVWLAEKSQQLCEQCTGEWAGESGNPKAEILNGRWECRSSPDANFGRKAPYLTKIRIFGAFLNDRLDEFVRAHKRHRARAIHELGWS